jgi:hypothetical protein
MNNKKKCYYFICRNGGAFVWKPWPIKPQYNLYYRNTIYINVVI